MTWDELVEIQPNIVKILTNSLRKNRLSHAYLIEGGKGTKKLPIALQLAKSLLCLHRDDVHPCLQCVNCKRIDSSNHPDIHVIEPDGASIKTEQINALKEEFSYRSMESSYKIYIIQQAEKMTPQAANKLLKFLEEPHPGTVAILLTEAKHQLLDTIRSRCQELSTRPLSKERLYNRLVEEQYPAQLARISVHLTNDYSECVALCTDEWFAQARKLVVQLTEELQKNSQSVLLFIQLHWMNHFHDKDKLDIGLDLLLLWMKDLLYVQLGQKEKVVYEKEAETLSNQALTISKRQISNDLFYILEAKKQLRANANPQLLMERLMLSLQEG